MKLGDEQQQAKSSLSGRHLLIVDDDHAYAQYVASCLEREGLQVAVAHSLTGALKLSMRSDLPFDAALIDVCLPTDHGIRGLQIEGFNLAAQLRQEYPEIVLIGCSAFMSRESIERLSAVFDANLEKPVRIEDLTRVLRNLLGPTGRRRVPKIFIVHGHDEGVKLALKNFIQNTLQLGEPVILHEQPSFGRTIIEKFEELAQNIDVVFVIMTPDDISGADAAIVSSRRARQNVVLELGFFLAKLQRSSGRVIVLHKGPIEIPSDISGIIYIDISRGVETAGEEIRRELRQWLV